MDPSRRTLRTHLIPWCKVPTRLGSVLNSKVVIRWLKARWSRSLKMWRPNRDSLWALQVATRRPNRVMSQPLRKLQELTVLGPSSRLKLWLLSISMRSQVRHFTQLPVIICAHILIHARINISTSNLVILILGISRKCSWTMKTDRLQVGTTIKLIQTISKSRCSNNLSATGRSTLSAQQQASKKSTSQQSSQAISTQVNTLIKPC